MRAARRPQPSSHRRTQNIPPFRPTNSRSISLTSTMTMPTLRRLLTLCLASAFLFTPSAPAQTLARPGWVGSGMNTDVWWKHAIVYQVNPLNFNPPTDKDSAASGLHGVAQRLDYIHSLGADALLLTAIQPDAAHAQSIDPVYGTLD